MTRSNTIGLLISAVLTAASTPLIFWGAASEGTSQTVLLAVGTAGAIGFFAWFLQQLVSMAHAAELARAESKDIEKRERDLALTMYSLASRPEAQFSHITRNANRVSMSSSTGISVLNGFRREIESMAAGGCKFRILMENRDADAIKASRSANFQRNAVTARAILDELRMNYPTTLEVRLTNKPLGSSILVSERPNPAENRVQVLLYLKYAAKGAGRPMLEVKPDNVWYRVFATEFEELWEAGEPVKE